MGKQHLAVIPSVIMVTSLAACVASRPAPPAQTVPAAPAPAAAQSAGVPVSTVASSAPAAASSALQEVVGWFCPMHPNHTSHEAGRCPICGMALVAGNPYDTRDYLLAFSTDPAVVRAGSPFKMKFDVQHPGTGARIQEYEVVHDKQYHLFVISNDLNFFQHVHPERQLDGSWLMEMTLPEPGYYRILSDFLPSRGSPQFLSRTLVTADYEGDMEEDAGGLEPDTVFKKTVDTITASVEFDPPHLIAGQYGHLRFALTDAQTGLPVTDLQPYLGAFGHTLILSEDMVDYVHSHPSEGPESDISRGLGGPRVSFEGYMPRQGRYRSWTQFLRNNQLTTISFTFDVLTLDQAMRGR
jgi:hypothetical protein